MNPKNQNNLIEFKFDEVFKRLERMEQKMNDFAFVKQTDFETYKKEFAKEIKDTYATKTYVKPAVNAIFGLIAIMATVVVGAIIAGRFK